MKKITSLLLTLVMVLGTALTSFAADFDFYHETGDENRAYTLEKVMDELGPFEDVVTYENEFFVEFGNKYYKLKDISDFVKANPGKTIADAAAAGVADFPKPSAGLKVVSVSAISKTEVEVEFAEALAEDVKDATLTVLDNTGQAVEVVKKDLLKGAKNATFKFVKALVKAPEGKWTVNGVVKDLDLEAKLLAVKKAGDDQMKLQVALEALEIKNINPAKYPDYAKANKANVAGYKSVEEVQKMVDDVNALDESGIVKAVQDAVADSNAVALAKALSNPAFKRVNSNWVNVPFGYMTNILPADKSIKAIQGKLDNSNTTILNLAPTLTKTGIDRAKLEASKKMIMDYALFKEDGITPEDITVAASLKAIDIQLLVTDAAEATMPRDLKNAVDALKALVPAAMTEEYIEANGEDYVAAIENAAVGAKDTAAKINTLLGTVNGSFDKFVIKEQPDGIKGIATARPEFVVQALDKKGKPFTINSAATLNAVTGIPQGGGGAYQIKGANTFTDAPTSEMTIEANGNVDLSTLIGQTLDIKVEFTLATYGGPDAAKINKMHTLRTQLKVVAADIDEGNSQADIKADKKEYKVGDTMTITFTLKDAANNVVHEYDGKETDAIVVSNSTNVALGKAVIANGKVTVTAVAEMKNGGANTYTVHLVSPNNKFASAGANTIDVKEGLITDFDLEKGSGKKLKVIAKSGGTQLAGNRTIVLTKLTIVKLSGGNEIPTEYTDINLPVLLTAGAADDVLTNALPNGDYKVTFTFQEEGKEPKTFIKTVTIS